MSFPRYESYKDSGVEWLGNVPEHWNVARLGYECDTVVPMRDKPEDLTGEIPWIRIEDFNGKYISSSKSGQGVSEATVSAMNLKVFPAGSVLCSCSCSMGATAIVTRPLVTNQTFIGIVPKSGYLSDFLFYLFLAATDHLNSIGTGAIQSYLSRDDFRRLRIPHPKYSEQLSITSFLDRETAKIDALIAEQQRLIELLKEKRQAVISHAVTKGLNPDAAMKDSGIEWLGEVPEHWEVKPLKYLVADVDGIQMGPFGGMLLDLEVNDTGFKVYGQENTISGDFSAGNRWLSENRFATLHKYHLQTGDLVLTRKGSLGNSRLIKTLPQPGIIDSDTIRLRVNDELIQADFLSLLLHEAQYVSEQIMLCKRGAILAGINTETISNITIVLPKRFEQDTLMKMLSSQVQELDSGIYDSQQVISLLQERRSTLISAAVTGKIDVRGLVAAVQPQTEAAA
jgi:type I restriction enzyme S subunit